MLHIGVIGAGTRGWSLAGHVGANPEQARVWAVADPARAHRDAFGQEHEIPAERRFATHAELLSHCPDLDGVLITTPVPSHAKIACDCLEAGVPVYLDKPMATTLADARRIVETAERTGTRLQVGFNLRYAPFFVTIRDLVAGGGLGDVLSIEWKEMIVPSHWAEYCRHPTYNRRDAVGSWLLEKCCHDIDLLNWIVGARCVRVASFASRSHFVPRTDVPEQCSPDCPIEADCIFSAAKLYGDTAMEDTGRRRIIPHMCVYHAGADLVDRQVAILEYENAVTVAFSLLPLGPENTRSLHICGTDATLRGRSTPNELRLHRYATGDETVIDPKQTAGGHGGADPRIILAFLTWLEDPNHPPRSGAAEGLEAMIVAAGIDLARQERRVVELDELRQAQPG